VFLYSDITNPAMMSTVTYIILKFNFFERKLEYFNVLNKV